METLFRTVCWALLLRVKLVAFLCGCFLEAVRAEIRGSVSVGVMESGGRLKVVWGCLCLVGFQKCVKDLIG